MRKLVQKMAIACCIVIGVSACGDKGTNVEPPAQPVVPELSQVQPEATYFTDNYPAGSGQKRMSAASYTNFNSAAGMVIGGMGFLAFQGVYSGFVEMAKSNDAEFEDGQWVWAYSYGYEQETAEVKLTANVNEAEGATDWALYISYDGSNGQNYDDFKFMKGTTSDEGMSGSWKIYSLDDQSGSALMADFDWKVSSSDQKSYSFVLYDVQGSDTFTINFEQDTPEYTMEFHSSDNESDATIYWNTETKMGYVIDHGEQSCWDANFQDTSCTE